MVIKELDEVWLNSDNWAIGMRDIFPTVYKTTAIACQLLIVLSLQLNTSTKASLSLSGAAPNILNMQFTTAFLTTALSFAAGTYAWAQAGDGTWVANNNWYTLWYNNGDSE